jgi:hypothetical protein
MFRFLKNLVGLTAKSHCGMPLAEKRRVRLSVETMEERLVMSTAAAGVAHPPLLPARVAPMTLHAPAPTVTVLKDVHATAHAPAAHPLYSASTTPFMRTQWSPPQGSLTAWTPMDLHMVGDIAFSNGYSLRIQSENLMTGAFTGQYFKTDGSGPMFGVTGTVGHSALFASNGTHAYSLTFDVQGLDSVQAHFAGTVEAVTSNPDGTPYQVAVEGTVTSAAGSVSVTGKNDVWTWTPPPIPPVGWGW